MILTTLLIYLGVKYHWGDHFKPVPNGSVELSIPVKDQKFAKKEKIEISTNDQFNPEIEKNITGDTLLTSMNKEQITEQCINLMSKNSTSIDSLSLELATVNCVVSNHQETFQVSHKLSNKLTEKFKSQYLLFKQRCNKQFLQNSSYSSLEKELLIGICVSDRLNTN